jgi:hypothetical protein
LVAIASAVSAAERKVSSSRAMFFLLWKDGYRLDVGEVE